MRKLWSVVNNLKMGSSDKNNLFVLTLFTICGIFGALIWLAIASIFLPSKRRFFTRFTSSSEGPLELGL